MKTHPTRRGSPGSKARKRVPKRKPGRSDQEKPAETCPCSLEDLTEEQQQAVQQFMDSLAGPSDEEFDKKFAELTMRAGEAANAGKDEEASEAALTMLLMAGAKALKSPSPDVQLANEALQRETAGDWTGAEEVRREFLALRERSGEPALIAKAQYDLSRLLRLLGRLDEACSYARAACESAREADLAPLSIMTLENEARCALERKDVVRALANAQEALQLVEPDRIYNQMRMRILTLRAQCRLENGDVMGAEKDLKSADKLESDLAFSGLGGAMALRAGWWEIQAELCIQQGHGTEAARGLDQAIALCREATEGCCSPSPYALAARARLLERSAELAKQLRHSAARQKRMREAKSLRQQAHLPLAAAPARPGTRPGRKRNSGAGSKRGSRK